MGGQRSAPRDVQSHRGAVALALFVTVLWSSSWVLIRWGLDDESLTPLTFAALRYGLAAMLLVGWVLVGARSRPWPRTMDRRLVARLVVLGVSFYALTQAAQFVALAEQPAATTGLVFSLTPLFVAMGAAVSLAEMPSRRQLGGAALVALGAWLFFSADLGATAAGMIAAVVGLGASVASSLLGRDINRSGRLPPLLVTTVSMAVGAVVLVLVAIATEGIPSVSPRGWLIIGWLAVVNTALAFTLWNVTLRRLSALESTGINNTMLIQVALLAWVFLEEAPGPVGLAGIALVSMGVFLTQVRAPSG